MISNERSWPSRRRPEQKPHPSSPRPQPRPFHPEDLLSSAELQIERKHFLFMLKENSRGRFLRIAEEGAGRSNSIIVPASGFAEFKKILAGLVSADQEIPPPQNPP